MHLLKQCLWKVFNDVGEIFMIQVKNEARYEVLHIVYNLIYVK